MTPTSRQLEILQHALGLDNYGRGSMYRNHYVAGLKDQPDCDALTEAGLMEKYPATELTGGAPLYAVTRAGKESVAEHSPKPPKLTRSQKRYREWLATDCHVSFGEFLRRGA